MTKFDIPRDRLREIGVPEDLSADDVVAFFSLPDDDDSMHSQHTIGPQMSLYPVALVMLKALDVACPDPVTIEPKDAADEIALNQLRDAEYVEMWDMHQNGDRRWIITKLGRERAKTARSPNR